MMTRFTRNLSSMTLGALVLLAGCDSSTEPILPGPPAQIEVGPEAVLLNSTGETAEIQVTVYDEDGNVIAAPSVEWHSSNEAVATVENGVVTAVGPGTATITVVSGTVSDSIVVEVDVTPTGPFLLLNAGEHTFTEADATFALTATVYDEDGNVNVDAEVEWTSSNEAVATVDEEGVVTAVAEGSATITATSGEVSASAEITVSIEAEPPTEPFLLLNAGEHTFTEAGTTFALTATVYDEDGNVNVDAEVEWTSSNEAVATVDEEGVVTAVAEGSATITATSGEVSASAEITVSIEDIPTGPSVVVIPETLVLASIGATQTLSTIVYDEEGDVVTDAEIEWASSNEAVATVDEDGVVTAVAEGSTTITATSGDVSGTAEVTVELAGPAVVVSPNSLLLSSVGATGTLAATVYDLEGLVVIDAEIDWTSSNEAVATVDEDGVVTAVAEGSTTITATSGALSGTTEVTVEISGGTEETPEP